MLLVDISWITMVSHSRQTQPQHASRDAADVLEAVHDVARDEDDAAGTRLGGLIADGHLIETLDDEQNLFLFEMDMIGRAFAGLVPRHDDRGGAAGGLGGEEHTSMSRPKGLIDNACLDVTTTGCTGDRASMDAVSSS